VADWVTISSLATAGGTLVLAAATFASVRSANRAARVAEQSLLADTRPLLMPSRPEDVAQKVGFSDDHYVSVAGSSGTAEVADGHVYLTMSVRNAGRGIAVLHGWQASVMETGASARPAHGDFRRLTRDLYIADGDLGFWQGVVRDDADPQLSWFRSTIEHRQGFLIDVLYGDHQGGQRLISRFGLHPRSDGNWFVSSARHWNVDRPDPR
jgi:hypothetical protein